MDLRTTAGIFLFCVALLCLSVVPLYIAKKTRLKREAAAAIMFPFLYPLAVVAGHLFANVAIQFSMLGWLFLSCVLISPILYLAFTFARRRTP